LASVLVTGGAGFIGSNFCRYWAQNHASDAIIVVDSLTYAANRDSISDVRQVDLHVADICDTAYVANLLRERNIQTIVHLAAESHVDRSILGPDAFIETNIVGTHSLLKAARAVWLEEGSGKPHRFHHVSTDEVFGSLEENEAGFQESSPYAPNSPYAASKASSDHLVRSYNKTFGLAVTTSNCSNNYGPFQHPEKLIPTIILNALSGKHLPLFGDGLNVRDWIHVDDHCRGIEACLAHGVSGQTYNIGGNNELANIVVVDAICNEIDLAFSKDSSLTERFPSCPASKGHKTGELKRFVRDRAGHDRRYAIDGRRAQDDLGFTPEQPFGAGLAETVRWYLNNQKWWQKWTMPCHTGP